VTNWPTIDMNFLVPKAIVLNSEVPRIHVPASSMLHFMTSPHVSEEILDPVGLGGKYDYNKVLIGRSSQISFSIISSSSEAISI